MTRGALLIRVSCTLNQITLSQTITRSNVGTQVEALGVLRDLLSSGPLHVPRNGDDTGAQNTGG